MDNKNSTENNKKPSLPKGPKVPFNVYWIYLAVILVLGSIFFFTEDTMVKETSWSEFQDYTRDNCIQEITVYNRKFYLEAVVRADSVEKVFKDKASKVGKKPTIIVTIPSSDKVSDFFDQVKTTHNYDLKIKYENGSAITDILINSLPFLLLIGIWIYILRRSSGGGSGGGGIFSVGKAKAQLYDKSSDQRKTFKDVAGLAEAKEEIQEFVEFLKNPTRYTEIGGKIPKGALLVGPPGTGKTLLAKAVAGEADVPFFSMSGSDFVEMFVGVGASRVRDLFKQAKEKSPCIIFIDEIDAIGRARGRNPNMGSNDERENTLNQLLTEMDGFGTNSGIIMLAATNRADILDKALLRAGRFDRQIYVDLPDLNGRVEIFNVHLRPVKIDETVDVEFLARQTPGFSGADIANVCNEAALIAARKGKKAVGKQDFTDAVDRIVGGLEKKTKVTTLEERKTIAIHEAGHATLSWFLEHADPLVKVTIVPRGKALGAAWYLPEERQITTKEQMLDKICTLLGGRAAEDVFLGRISSGASNDLERVTKQVYSMVAYLGMSEKMPNLSYYDSSGEAYGFNKPYSDETALLIDKEVHSMIAEQYERAKYLLKKYEDGHHKLTNVLIDREVIFADDLKEIFGDRQWASRSEEILIETENSVKEAQPETPPVAPLETETPSSEEQKDDSVETDK